METCALPYSLPWRMFPVHLRMYILLMLCGVFYACLLGLVHGVVQVFFSSPMQDVLSIIESKVFKSPASRTVYLSHQF